MVDIVGLQKTTMLDYPGVVACTVFLPGCDFRCPFCHNPTLINDAKELPVMPEEEFFDFLESRKGWLDGVCITGGEPCLSQDLHDFIRKIKAMGFKVKLDTNGSLPSVLKSVINDVDSVAMDIKSCRDKYSQAAGVNVNIKNIEESVKVIRESGLPYEFRTTILPRLHSRDDLISIGNWLKGSDFYALQQFRADFGVLNPDFREEKSYSRKDLEDFAEMLRPFFKKVVVRAD